MRDGELSVRGLEAEAGEFRLAEVDLSAAGGEYLVILGPTGAGKTILLEAIAGMRRIRRGKIILSGEDVTHLPPEKRGIGFVYQDYALFPHLSAFDNIAFGLRLRRVKRPEVDRRVRAISRLIGIEDLLPRAIDGLSGGEKQRVALARALVISPRALLLDEPLSALDPQYREELQRVLARIHRELSPTTVHVTHDFEEAVSLGDRVAVMEGGKIVQAGTVHEIFRRPNSPFVARFVGARNVFSGEVIEGEDEEAKFRVDGAAISVVTDLRGPAHAAVRPEDILISRAPLQSSARNSFRGRITEIVDRGMISYVRVNVPPEFICAITRQSITQMDLNAGMEVYISFKASAVHVF